MDVDGVVKLLPEALYEELLDKIVSKKWRIGDRIPSESELCRQYGMSRITVRAAIQKLRAQNMVLTRPGCGTFVTSNRAGENAISAAVGKMDLSQDEYRHVVELRRALEFTAIDLMMKYGEPRDFERLFEALQAMRASGSDTESYVLADYQFHWGIIRGSHNPLFASVMNGCKDVFMRYFREQALVSDGNFSMAIRNHTRIYEALVSRNGKLAKDIILGTFEYNLERFRYSFRNE